MKNVVKLTAVLMALAWMAGCGTGGNVDNQSNEIAKNIIIMPESAEVIDTATIKKIVTDLIECDQWSSVTVLAQPRGDRFALFGQLASKDVYQVEFFQAMLDPQYKVIEMTYDEFWPVAADSKSFYPSCPDSNLETYWTTECSTINTAASVIRDNDEQAKSEGYVSKREIGNGESLTNVRNYLSCSGLKVWGRVGHGYTGGLQLAGGGMLTNFDGINLKEHGLYANSCLAFNQPFRGKVFDAGADWYVSGITNLYIGPSEATFRCTMKKALAQENVCSSVKACLQSGAGQHGCDGPNQIIPQPNGDNPNPTPTPTPGPTPTPTPGPTPNPGESCVNPDGGKFCGRKAPRCWCDDLCKQYDDCCPDYDRVCGDPGPTPTPTPGPTPTPNPTPTPSPGESCVNPNGGDYCDWMSPSGCWCIDSCEFFDNCCPDKEQVCG